MRFSSEYQPQKRGRKPGSLGKANQLIRNAAPDVVDAVIQKAKSGDITAASLILARAVPPLKAVSPAIAIEGPVTSLADLVKALLIAGIDHADPGAVSQLIRATHDATKVLEVAEWDARLRALEESL
mgnify:CR=1 FL=1|jgi:hypothetical protein